MRRRLAREAERKRLPTSARRWAEWQYRKCSKAGCKSCGAAGLGHGPYWYVFFRDSPGAPLRSRYVGRYLDADAAEALAVLETRREASARRSRLVSEILAGRHDSALGLPEPPDLDDPRDEGRPGWRAIVEELVARWTGLTPEEVFPDDFEPGAVECAREKRLRKERRSRERAAAGAKPGPLRAAAEREAETTA